MNQNSKPSQKKIWKFMKNLIGKPFVIEYQPITNLGAQLLLFKKIKNKKIINKDKNKNTKEESYLLIHLLDIKGLIT